jgi:hypothetical protein
VDASGYSNEKYSLTVKPTPDLQILPSDWRLDNLYGPDHKPKVTAEYMTTYEFDVDGDGKYETKKDDYAFELRFENVKNSGIIWLRMVPISDTDSQKLPRVLIRDYIEAIAQTGYEVSVISGNVRISAQKRFATETLSETEGTLAGAPAHAFTLNVANVDQVQLEKAARSNRVKLVLARPPVEYHLSPPKNAAFPMALVAGYANHPDDFAAGLPVFDDFLARIGVRGVAGASLRETAAKPPATAPAEPSPPAPTESAPGPAGSPPPVSAAP